MSMNTKRIPNICFFIKIIYRDINMELNVMHLIEPNQYTIKDEGNILILIPSESQKEIIKIDSPLIFQKQMLISISKHPMPNYCLICIDFLVKSMLMRYQYLPNNEETQYTLKYLILETINTLGLDLMNKKAINDYSEGLQIDFNNAPDKKNKDIIGMKMLIAQELIMSSNSFGNLF